MQILNKSNQQILVTGLKMPKDQPEERQIEVRDFVERANCWPSFAKNKPVKKNKHNNSNNNRSSLIILPKCAQPKQSKVVVCGMLAKLQGPLLRIAGSFFMNC